MKKKKWIYDKQNSNWIYDSENDIYFCNFGGKVESSMELLDGNLILDFNQEGDIVGFEIMDFEKEIKKSIKKHDKIFKKFKKGEKK